MHEGGHTLGLKHVDNSTAIMFEKYHKTVDDNGNYIEPELTQDDIKKIQDLYGRMYASTLGKL